MNERFDKLVPGLPNKVHMAVDLALVVLGVDLAMKPGRHHGHMILLSASCAIAWLLTALITRIYSPSTPRRLIDNLTLRAISAFGVLAALKGMSWLTPGIDAQDVLLSSFFFFFFLASATTRALLFKPLQQFGRPIQNVLIVGTGSMGQATYRRLEAGGHNSVVDQLSRPVGFLTLNGDPKSLHDIELPIYGKSEVLLEILQEHPVSEVYIAGRIVEHAEEMQAVVDVCERVGMPFALPLHALHFERAQLLSNSPARDGFLHYMSTAQKPIQYGLKRLLDIVASAVALLILSPLLLGTAIGIKLTSRGPVFFKQTRVGLHGVTFGLLKFRSMVTNADDIKDQLMAQNEQSGPVFKMKNDPRITGIGHFIRRFSIDELPQLINILRGDMTIVGPRPAVPKEVVQYKAWQRRRLSVRPGLTCYWQVGGRNAIGFEEWMRLDLRYVDNWTLWVDFSLIAQTFPAVLAGRGAS